MKQRIITGIEFVLLVLLFIVPSLFWPIIMLLFSICVGSVVIFELLKATKTANMNPVTGLVVAGGLLAVITFIITYFIYRSNYNLTASLGVYLLVMVPYCFACLIIPSVMHKNEEVNLLPGLVTAGIVLYVTFPMFLLASVSQFGGNGMIYTIPALFAAWVSDTCAYFVGVTIGKHKIVPHISPKKTWEGCIGGAVGCGIVVMLYYTLLLGNLDDEKKIIFSILAFILGFIMSVMSQLGDWLASLIKRTCGIKDFSNIFPGHGGMLDRFDSAFFTIPIGVALAILTPFFFV